MRRLLWVVLTGCGRLGFDATGDSHDGPPDLGDDGAGVVLAITAPLEGAEVGPGTEVAGTCAPGEVTLAGADLVGEATVPCVAGQWSGAVTFTSGFGGKKIEAHQGSVAASRAVERAPLTVKPKAVRSSQRPSMGGGVNCTLEIEKPPATEDGDLLIGMIYTDGSTLEGSIGTPGWTRLAVDGATRVAFYKIASGEGNAYDFPVVAGTAATDTCASAGAIVSFENVDPEAPIDAQSSAFDFGQQVVAPGATASVPTMLVAVFGSNGPPSGIMPQAGLELVGGGVPEGSNAQSTSGAANALVTWQLVPAGPTGTRAATIAGTADFAGGLVVLRPR